LSCEFAQTRLHAYLDGELDVAGSVISTSTCRSASTEALREEEKLRQAIQGRGCVCARAGGAEVRVEETLLGPRLQTSSGIGFWRWVAVGAAMLIVVALGWRQFAAPQALAPIMKRS
jgi:hypothetical protein